MTATSALHQHLDPFLAHLSELCVCQSLQGRPRSSVGESLRFEVITRLMEAAYQTGAGMKAGQLACCYFDAFCSKWAGWVKELLYAVALTALLVASKLEGTVNLTPAWVSSQTALSARNISDLECLMLTILDWDLDLPTAAEISRLLLVTAYRQDCAEVAAAGDSYASICYSANSLLEFGPEAIAVASVECALEQRGNKEIAEQWTEAVLGRTKVEKTAVQNLSHLIKARLVAMCASDSETDCGSPDIDTSS